MNNKPIHHRRRERLRLLFIILCSITLVIGGWMILQRNMLLSSYSSYSLGEISFSIDEEKRTLLIEKDNLMAEYDFQGNRLRTLPDKHFSFPLSPKYLLFEEEREPNTPERTFAVGGTWTGTAVKQGILDADTGKVILEPKFFEYKTPSEGLIPVHYHSEENNVVTLGQWGYLDMKGREISGPSFDYAGEFKNGIAEVGIIVASKQTPVGRYIELEVFHIDREMNRVSNPIIAESEGIVLKKRFLSGYITEGDFSGESVDPQAEYWFETKGGKLLGGQTFDNARPFQNGFAAVCRNNLWGVIDSSGKLVVEFRYEKIGDFSEGYASVWGDFRNEKEGKSDLSTLKKHGDAGKIALNGEVILPCRFDEVYDTHEGHFTVYKGGKPYLLSAEGQIVLKPSQFGTGQSSTPSLVKLLRSLTRKPGHDLSAPILQDGHIIFEARNRHGVMNLQGELVIPPIFEEISYLGEGKYLAFSDFQNPFEVILDTENNVWKDGQAQPLSK